jgi:hypothetical protein
VHRLIAGSVALALTFPGLLQVARADTLPPSAADLTGARALGLSGYRAMPAGNEGMFVNPASIAARRRYSLELQYVFDAAGPFRDAHMAGISVVDSQLSPVAAGLAVTRLAAGESRGWAVHFATASPLSPGVFLGVGGKYLSIDAAENASGFATDAGLFWEVTPTFALGAVGYNLVGIGSAEQTPRGAGAGFSIGKDNGLRVAVDWRADFQRHGGDLTHAFAGGAEMLVARRFPLRAGFLADQTREGRFWSVGAGVVSDSGVAIDLGFHQDVKEPEHRAFAVGLKWFPGMP